MTWTNVSWLGLILVLVAFGYGIWVASHEATYGRTPRSARPRPRPTPQALLDSLVPERERELEAVLEVWDEAIQLELARADRAALARRGV